MVHLLGRQGRINMASLTVAPGHATFMIMTAKRTRRDGRTVVAIGKRVILRTQPAPDRS